MEIEGQESGEMRGGGTNRGGERNWEQLQGGNVLFHCLSLPSLSPYPLSPTLHSLSLSLSEQGALWKHCYLLESAEVQEEREMFLEKSEESLKKSLSFGN